MQKELLIDFTLVFNRFKKPLFNYLDKIVRSEMLAEDLLQNVFMKFYDSIENIRDKEKIERWLFITARNEIYSHFRSKKNSILNHVEFSENHNPTNNLVSSLESDELITVIENELNTMDSSQREVYYLKEYSNLSYKEIAGMLEITEELVKSRLFKVRQKLRIVVENYERG
jgi:RNA polymerase sigma-70 factor, ECF subfamily